MIDLKQLKHLIKLMVDNDLCELDLHDGEQRVSLKRGVGGVPQVLVTPHPSALVTAPTPAAASSAAPVAGPAAPADEDAGLVAITSPMVGTYYAAPSPDAEPFVTPGSKVTPDSNVCIIEAMKVFNEIKAETSGTIEKVLVKSGQAVEFGQKLYLVRPS